MKRRKNPLGRRVIPHREVRTVPMSAKERAFLTHSFRENAALAMERAREAKRLGRTKGLYSAEYYYREARSWSSQAMKLKRGDRLTYLEKQY